MWMNNMAGVKYKWEKRKPLLQFGILHVELNVPSLGQGY